MSTYRITIVLTVKKLDDAEGAADFGWSVRDHLFETFNDDQSFRDIKVSDIEPVCSPRVGSKS